jgi:hypothetical protein
MCSTGAGLTCQALFSINDHAWADWSGGDSVNLGTGAEMGDVVPGFQHSADPDKQLNPC